MKPMRIGFIALVFSIAHSAWASYPTVWTLSNRTDEVLFLYCVSHNPAGLLGQTMYLETQVISPYTTQTYTWRSYYNNGSGLNPGSWFCHVDNHPEVGVRAIRGQLEFGTNWGENVMLKIERHFGFYFIDKF
jgi:hypothetical protein